MILIQHLFEAHNSVHNFTFTCEIGSCGHVFTTGSSYSGYLTHRHRKHPNWRQQIVETTSIDAGDIHANPLNCYESSNRDDHDDGDFTDIPALDAEETVQGCNESENIESIAAHFLLALKEIHKLTQVTLDFILISISKLIKIILGSIKLTVLEKTREKDPSIIPLLVNCFLPVDPFQNLKTEYQQTKFYKEYFSLVVSCIGYR